MDPQTWPASRPDCGPSLFPAWRVTHSSRAWLKALSRGSRIEVRAGTRAVRTMAETTTRVWSDQASDAELILGVRSGDPDAYRVLFERHAGAARRVAFAYTSVSADVDDIVSDAFEAVLRALQDGNGPTEAFRAYLFTVVRRTARDLRRRADRTSPVEDMSIHDVALGRIAPTSDATIAKFEHATVAEAFAS